MVPMKEVTRDENSMAADIQWEKCSTSQLTWLSLTDIYGTTKLLKIKRDRKNMCLF